MCHESDMGSGSPTMSVPASLPRIAVSLNHVMKALRCNFSSSLRRMAIQSSWLTCSAIGAATALEEADDVIERDEEDEQNEHREPERVRVGLEAAVQGPSCHGLDEHEEKPPAIQGRERQEIQNSEAQADESERGKVEMTTPALPSLSVTVNFCSCAASPSPTSTVYTTLRFFSCILLTCSAATTDVPSTESRMLSAGTPATAAGPPLSTCSMITPGSIAMMPRSACACISSIVK